MTDPIADMLARIRNASAVKKNEVILPMSKIKYEIAKILEREDWIQKTEIVKSSINKGVAVNLLNKQKIFPFDQLRIILKYKKSGRPAINFLKRISKPGLKVYVGKDELPRVLNGFGLAIISTSQGLMTNKEAREKKIGGEVVCEIY